MAAPTQSEEHRYAIPVLYHPYHPSGPSSLPFQNGQQLCVADLLNIVFSINENSYVTRTTPAMRQDMYNFICKSRSMRHFFRDAFWWIYLQHLADKDLEVALNSSQQNSLLSDADSALLSLEAVEERVRKMAPKGPKGSVPANTNPDKLKSPGASQQNSPRGGGNGDGFGHLRGGNGVLKSKYVQAHLFSPSLPAHLEVSSGVGNRQKADVIRVGCPRSYGNMNTLSTTLEDPAHNTTTSSGINTQSPSTTRVDHKNEFYKVEGTHRILTERFYGHKKKPQEAGADEDGEDPLAASVFQMSSTSLAKKIKQRHVVLVGGLHDSGSDQEGEDDTATTAVRDDKKKNTTCSDPLIPCESVDATLKEFVLKSVAEVQAGDAAQQRTVMDNYINEVSRRSKHLNERKAADRRRKIKEQPRTTNDSSRMREPSPTLSEASSSRASSVDSVCSQRLYMPTAELEAVGGILLAGDDIPLEGVGGNDSMVGGEQSIDHIHLTPEDEANNAIQRERAEIRKLLTKRGYVNLARIPVAARHPIVAKEQHKLFTRMSLNYTKALISSITSHFSHYKVETDEDGKSEEGGSTRGGGGAGSSSSSQAPPLPPIHGSRKQSVIPGAHLGFTATQHKAVQRHRTSRPQHYILRDMISRFIPDLLSQGLYLAFVLAMPFAANTHLGGKFQESILHHVTFWLGGVEMNMRPVVGSMASLMVPPPGFTAPLVDHHASSSSSHPHPDASIISSGTLSPSSARGGRGRSPIPETAPSRLIVSSVSGVSTSISGSVAIRDASNAALVTESLAASVSVSSWPVQNVVMLIRRRRRDQLTRLKQGLFAFDNTSGEGGMVGGEWGQADSDGGSISPKRNEGGDSPHKYGGGGVSTSKKNKATSMFDNFRRRHRHDPYFPQEITIQTLNVLIATSKRDAKRRERNAARMREEIAKNAQKQAIRAGRGYSLGGSLSPPPNMSKSTSNSPSKSTFGKFHNGVACTPPPAAIALNRQSNFASPAATSKSLFTQSSSPASTTRHTPRQPPVPRQHYPTPPSTTGKSGIMKSPATSGTKPVVEHVASNTHRSLSIASCLEGDSGSKLQLDELDGGVDEDGCMPVLSKHVRFIGKGRGPEEGAVGSNKPSQHQQQQVPSPPPSNKASRRPDIICKRGDHISGGGGESSSKPVISTSSTWMTTSPVEGSKSRHQQRPSMLNPSDISQRGDGIHPTTTTTTNSAAAASARSPSTTTFLNDGSTKGQFPTFAATTTTSEAPDRAKQARTERLIERQVLAFQREMGRLTNTHTFAAFHNFLSESEDVKYQKEHEAKVGARSSDGGGAKKASDLQDDRRVDNFLLGSLAAQTTPRRGSVASVTTPGGAASSNKQSGGGGKTAPQSKHSTSRNVQTIKADLDEKFLPSTPWWMKSNSRIRRPARGHWGGGDMGGDSGEGGSGSGLLGGFESCVGMLHHGTQTPKGPDSAITGDPSAVIPVGLKFGLSNWSPLVHRYMLLFAIENNTPTSSISWTV